MEPLTVSNAFHWMDRIRRARIHSTIISPAIYSNHRAWAVGKGATVSSPQQPASSYPEFTVIIWLNRFHFLFLPFNYNSGQIYHSADLSWKFSYSSTAICIRLPCLLLQIIVFDWKFDSIWKIPNHSIFWLGYEYFLELVRSYKILKYQWDILGWTNCCDIHFS